MSDGGIWQPPDPTAAAPVPEPAARAGPRGKIVGAAVGAVAIVGAGTFAVARIAGDDDAGGAATPEEAGLAFVDAMGNEDLLGMVDVLLPGERQALRGPLSDIVDELQRLEVLNEEADASAISGVDFEFEDVSVDADATNVDDIANLTIDGDGHRLGRRRGAARRRLDPRRARRRALRPRRDRHLRGRPAPRHRRGGGRPLVPQRVPHRRRRARARRQARTTSPRRASRRTAATARRRRWTRILDAVEDLDLEAMIAALDPDEMQALQRYAPLFLDDAQAELDEAACRAVDRRPLVHRRRQR